MGNIERKKKPQTPPKPWDYLGWQGEQPTIDDLPSSADRVAEVESLRRQLAGAVEALEKITDTPYDEPRQMHEMAQAALDRLGGQ